MRLFLPRHALLAALFLATASCSAGSSGTEGEGTPGGGDAGNEATPSDTGGGDDGGVDGADLDGASDADETSVDDTGSTGDSGGSGDTSGDGSVITGCGTDSDGDGITDTIEGRFATGGPTDTDGDGTPDYLDTDSDDDSIPDAVEWFTPGCDSMPFADLNDADGDGIPNFQDTDSDGNGLSDKLEACPPAAVLTALSLGTCAPTKPFDFDGDGVPDWLDFDNDHDSSKTDKTIGLADQVELSDATGKYVGLTDTDKDGIPDVYDRDSDGDFILDLDDGSADSDGDGKQNFRDLDSDGDGVGDSCEARANASPTVADLPKPLRDTNGNGIPDYLDHDSDGDLLADGLEDKNGNCVVDAAETDRIKADTDGDGVSDLIEVALLGVSGAKDPSITPAKAGKFYFLEPYSVDGSAAPSPTASTLALSTQLNKGDVGFIVDTTGSMSGEIANLKSSLSSTIIPALKTKIPDLGIGAAGHDDFPYSTYGYGVDLPYYDTSPSGWVTTSTTAAQSAVNSFSIHNGYDGPESQNAAIFHAVNGGALSWPGGSVGAASPPAGTFGALHFRSDAFPIAVEITDADFHNGKRALNLGGTSYDTGFQNTYSFTAPTSDDVVNALKAVGAKFIGVAADNGGRLSGGPGGNPYEYEAYIADKTGSTVPPSAFGGSCKTGVSGGAVAADGPGGSCRLVFSVNTDGTGLSTSIVDGVYAILASIKFDVYVEAYDGTGEPIAVVDSFMSKVEPQPSGGTDPVTGTACVTFPATSLADQRHTPHAYAGAGDIQETILQVNPGSYYCFAVTPKPNTTVKPTTSPQTFHAWLRVDAVKPTGGTFTLGSDREVLFVVPPVLN